MLFSRNPLDPIDVAGRRSGTAAAGAAEPTRTGAAAAGAAAPDAAGWSVGGVLVSVVLLLACVLGVLMLAPVALGLDRYVITGGSMGDAVPKGSIAYTREVPVSDLRVGDVITYTPPAGSGPGGKVTHRIVWAGRGASGARAFRTQGDANASADPWKFELHGATQAQVVGHVPFAGYPIAALSLRWVRMLVIGLPAALIALAMLASLVADSRRPQEVAA